MLYLLLSVNGAIGYGAMLHTAHYGSWFMEHGVVASSHYHNMYHYRDAFEFFCHIFCHRHRDIKK